jgi:hypothetical protein
VLSDVATGLTGVNRPEKVVVDRSGNVYFIGGDRFVSKAYPLQVFVG